MRILDPIIQEEILLKTYVTADDIYRLYPFGKNQARELFLKIEKELTLKKVGLPIARPRVILLDEVVKLHYIDEAKIKKAAKLRKELLNGN